MGVAAMLTEARRWIGTSGRPNTITRDYADRHGAGFLDAPWCDMAITYWARNSGNVDAVLPAGDRAYTPWHAADFQRIGRWHPGTFARLNAAKPGDIVFFDWGGSDSIGAIDHVGIIERVLGDGRVQTIEGNTGDQCLRRVRGANVIAGFGRPDYETHQQEETMPDYISAGVADPQDFPPNEWVTITWGTEYADAAHHHWDKGGSSVVIGPAYYSLAANVRIEGLPVGTEIQARAVERHEDSGDIDGGPLAEYAATSGATFVHYALPADVVSANRRVRFQVIHYGQDTGRITGGSVKALAWPT